MPRGSRKILFVRVADSVLKAACFLHMRTLHSLLHPGPERADPQPHQWISSAGGGRRAAALRSAPGNGGGKDANYDIPKVFALDSCRNRIDWL